ncbi:alpha/beta hydrolase [Cohnella lubricantis]|uniref:Alpha/beta hydrolase n=2 Tax=Cohnella lubricantis TaxID=2163172 RepID=A0A841T579_9BACL|nr:alpha/beta hydrolase [Cohnella lubricantis]
MLAGSGAAATAALLLVFCLYLYRFAIERTPKSFMRSDPNMPQVEEKIIREVREWFRAQPFEDVTIRSHDGLALQGRYLEAKCPTENAVILAHGYSGRGEDMAVFARFYHEQGFRVLMPDNRGHGRSDGHYIGFGWHDRHDYVRWIEYMVRRIGERAKLVLHGVSMGGGIVLMTSGEPLPPQVRCIVSDCAYTSVKAILKYQLRQIFKLPAFPLLPLTSLVCKCRAGYFFGEGSAIRQLRNNKLPILLIHGDSDTFVPTSMAAELFEAIRGPKDQWIVPGAQHATSFLTDRQKYESTVLNFVQKYISAPAQPAEAQHLRAWPE